jgi:hypothetical protein
MAWHDTLLPASWRGIPFGVVTNANTAGRMLAIHQYPLRDVVWPEDLGKAPRRFQIQGFLVGDNVQLQRIAFIRAAEVAGPGTLVHPTMGIVQVTLLSSSFAEEWREGRVVNLQLEFIEQGSVLFPVISPATGILTALAAVQSVVGVAASYVAAVQGVVSLGASVVGQIVGVVSSFASIGQQVAGDAAAAIGAVTGLVGNFGRYGSGKRTQALPESATVASQLTAQAEGHAAVLAAVAAAGPAVEADPVNGAPEAVRALVVAVAAAGGTPGDQIRIFDEFRVFAPKVVAGPVGLGAAMRAGQEAAAAMCRRHAVIGMAEAARSYQPDNYQDAVATRDLVCAALDEEITGAGDVGDDAAYLALRDLRTSIADDLTERAAKVARLREVEFSSVLPALVQAQMLYRDGARGDDLVARAGVVHPAFMPVSFMALDR